MKLLHYIIVLLSLLIISCKFDQNNKDLQPTVTGKAGELLLIVDNNKWKSPVGDSLSAFFGQDVESLPQEEPMFTLIHINNRAFSKLFETHRSIFRVKISPDIKKNSLIMRKNIWARPQIYFLLQANSDSAFFKIFNRNKKNVLDTLLMEERDRYIQTYIKFENQAIASALIKRSIRMDFPKGYNLDVNKDNFLWLSNETPLTSQGVIISFINYTDTTQFHKKELIHQIDSVLKKNVAGALKGTYMTIEQRVDVKYKKLILNGNFTVKLSGLWRTEGDFMGGPFEALARIDTKLNRIVIAFGYVYSPKYNKRDYLRQVDAILYSLN